MLPSDPHFTPPGEGDTDAAVEPDDILVLRRGPGANCSSIGSALDLLFLSAVAGGAAIAVVAAAVGPRQMASPERAPAKPPAPAEPAASAEPPAPEEPDARPR